MAYRVDATVPGKADWANTSWNVVLQDAAYLDDGTAIAIDGELAVTVTQAGNTTPPRTADLLGNGLLITQGVTAAERVTATGTDVPAGTPFWLILSMVILTDENGGASKKYVQGLTLVDDPEDAGIMGAEEG